MNKKRESELAKLRRDLEDANLNHSNQLAALQKKHNDAIAVLGDQLDQLQVILQSVHGRKNFYTLLFSILKNVF